MLLLSGHLIFSIPRALMHSGLASMLGLPILLGIASCLLMTTTLVEVKVVRRRECWKTPGRGRKARGWSYGHRTNIVFVRQVRAGEPDSLYISLTVWSESGVYEPTGTFNCS